jgi:hypothetical protein
MKLKLVKVLAVLAVILIVFLTLNMVSFNIKVESEQDGIRSPIFQI